MISKMDRLIVELKIPPQDAYFKILHTLEEVNKIIYDTAMDINSSSNRYISSNRKIKRISPELGNVCFSAGQHGWSFTLLTFAAKYCEKYNNNPDAITTQKKNISMSNINDKTTNTVYGTGAVMDPAVFAKRLWGDWYHDEKRNAFTKSSSSAASKALASSTSRTFVKFILDPIYKIYSHVLGENPDQITVLTKKLNKLTENRKDARRK